MATFRKTPACLLAASLVWGFLPWRGFAQPARRPQAPPIRRAAAVKLQPISPPVSGRAATAARSTKALMNKTIRDNEFEVHRGLDQYATLLGPDFFKRLMRLERHWIDAGAGEAKAAQQFLYAEALREHLSYARHEDGVYRRMLDRYFDGRLKEEEKTVFEHLQKAEIAKEVPLAHKPTVTAVSYSAAALNPPSRRSQGKFRFLRGRYFLDIPAKELTGRAGPAELITDVFGVFAYDPRPDLVLRRYLQTLSRDGAIYILVGLETGLARLSRHLVRGRDGTTASLVDWLKDLPGIEATAQRNRQFGLPASQSLRITKKAAGGIHVPKLKLIQVVEREGSRKLMPPLRIFQEE